MMIEFIVISLFVILFVDYKTSKKRLSRPSISYIAGFLLCAIVAYSWREEWGLRKMAYGTVFLFVGGALVFYLVEIYYIKIHPISLKIVEVKSDNFVPISSQKLVAFLFFQVVVFYLYSRFKMSYVGTDDLSTALGEVRMDASFRDIEIKVPFYVGLPYGFCRAAGYIWTILIPYYAMKSRCYNKQKILLIMNFIVCIIGVFLSGGRMGFLFYIIPLIFVYYILYQYMIGWKGGFFSKKVSLLIIIFSILFGGLFSQLGTLMGRQESTKTANMIFSIYCGAQIKNMDDYIQYSFKQGHEGEYFGQYTFKRVYKNFLDDLLGCKHRETDLSYFNSHGQYVLGNVYSTYQDYYIDFKYYGILLAGLMSLFVVFIYKRAVISHFWKDGRLSIWVMLYAYISHMPFLSFFANQFWGKISLLGDVYNVLYWFLLIIFMQGSKTNYYKKLDSLNIKI